ncbi:MAG: hypothetical protein HQM08_25370 [Candidatus Riflebacteria bacterium]|nr:hypothetical protein [Candidatus Riflebacteria bacterium]
MTAKNEPNVKHDIKGKIFRIKSDGPFGEDAGKAIETLVKKGLGEGYTDFLIDFGGTKAISSPAVAAILNSTEEIVDVHSGRVVLTGLTELNVKVFEMVGILLFAEIAPSAEEAEESLVKNLIKTKGPLN